MYCYLKQCGLVAALLELDAAGLPHVLCRSANQPTFPLYIANKIKVQKTLNVVFT